MRHSDPHDDLPAKRRPDAYRGPPVTLGEIWRAECEAIHREMERLILTPWPGSQEENQIRKIQLAALTERRNEAARHFPAEATIQRRSEAR
jgi:hypothetical protein